MIVDPGFKETKEPATSDTNQNVAMPDELAPETNIPDTATGYSVPVTGTPDVAPPTVLFAVEYPLVDVWAVLAGCTISNCITLLLAPALVPVNTRYNAKPVVVADELQDNVPVNKIVELGT